MPQLGFQKQFALLVESGAKRQTIRRKRKRPFKQGDTLYFYTGQRTKHCRKLGEAICTSVEPIEIRPGRVLLGSYPSARILSPEEVETLAIADGFESVETFFKFFGDGLEGQLIKWDEVQSQTTPAQLEIMEEKT